MVKVIELTMPDEFEGTPFEKEYLATAQQVIKEQTVLRLYKERKISTGRGARMLGISNYDFLQFLGQHQVSIFRYDDGELDNDLEAAMSARATTVSTEK